MVAKKLIMLALYCFMILPMVMSLTFLVNKDSMNPMKMLFMLISYILLSCLFISKVLPSFFLSYLMFMVTIGGVMIIFMYLVSLTNKDKYKQKNSENTTKNIVNSLIPPFILMPMLKLNLSTLFNYNSNEMMDITKFISNESYLKMSLMFNSVNLKMTILCMLLILIILISVVKLCSKHKGPLRQMKK